MAGTPYGGGASNPLAATRRQALKLASALGASLVGRPAPFAILTMPASKIDTAIDQGWINVCQRSVAACDGVTDDAPNINALTAEMESAGGGVVHMPRAPSASAYYRLGSSVQLRSGVTFQGEGKGSKLRCFGATGNAAQTFQGGGHSILSYPEFTYHALDDITSGQGAASVQNVADADHYSIGQVVLIRSTASEPNGDYEYPLFAVLNRIKDKDGDTLDFEYPFEYDVAAPLISDCLGAEFYGRDTGVIDRPVIRDLSVYADDANEGRWWAGDGVYQALIENIIVEKARFGFNANAFCYSTARNILGQSSAGAVELAVGSYKALVEHVGLGFAGGVSDRGFIHQAVEYARQLTFRHWRLNYRNFQFTGGGHQLLNIGPVQDVIYDDVHIAAPSDGGSVISIKNQEHQATKNIQIKDFVGIASNAAIGLNVSDLGNALAPEGIRIKGGRIGGAFSTGYSVRIGADCEMGVSDIDLSAGAVNVQTGIAVAGPGIERCNVGGWAGSFTALNALRKRENIRAGWDYSQETDDIVLAVTTTSAGNVVKSYTVPAGAPIVNRDAIRIRARGRVTGSTAQKRIQLIDSAGSIFDETVGMVDTGALVLDASLTFQSNTTVFVDVTYELPGIGRVTIAETRVVPSIAENGFAVDLRAWIETIAGPVIRVDSLKVWAALYGQQ